MPHTRPRVDRSAGVGLGHAERRAIAARTMKRSEWRALTGSLRTRARAVEAATKGALRARELLIELQRLTGCDVGRHPAPNNRVDILEARFYGLGAHAQSDPRDCLGIPGALRIALAMQWHPTRRSSFAPSGRPNLNWRTAGSAA